MAVGTADRMWTLQEYAERYDIFDAFLKSAQRRIKILTGTLDNINNREGACCPEDVGFDEYIRTLQAENKRLRESLQKYGRHLYGCRKNALAPSSESVKTKGKDKTMAHFANGEYIPLVWDGRPDAYYFKGHISHWDGMTYLLEEEIIDEETIIGPARRIYARWSMEPGEDGNQHILREYTKPGRGRFKVTEFGLGIFAKP